MDLRFRLLLLLAALLLPGFVGPVSAAEAPEEEAEPPVSAPEKPEEIPAAPVDEGPGAAREAAMARLIRRDDPLAALMECGAALGEVAAAARAGGPEADWQWARVEALLETLRELSAASGEHAEALTSLAAVAAPPPPALVAARVAWLRARLLHRADRPEEVAAAAEPLGLIRGWLLLGPFDNEQGRGFDLPLAPETKCDLAAPLRGKLRAERWRAHQSLHPLGLVDLGALLRPATECLAYALCLVRSPTDREAALRLGSDDGIAAWVNGREVLRCPATRELDLDQAAAGIRLKAGWNAILLKIGQGVGAWGFCARLTDLRGAPLTDLEFLADLERAAAPLASVPAAGAEEPPVVERGAIDALAARLTADPKDGRAAGCLGRLLLVRRSVEDERGARELLARAAELRPGDGAALLALAQALAAPGRIVPDREENGRRAVLERALRLGPDEAAAAVELGRIYLEAQENLERADAFAARALAANPLSPAALALRFDLMRRRGEEANAEALIREAVTRNPACPLLRLREADLALARGQTRRALEAASAAAAADATDPAAARLGFSARLQLGDPPAALELLHRRLALLPGDGWACRERLRLLLGRDPAAALAAAEEALRDCPADATLHLLRGDALREAGRRDEAAAAWREALALRPGDPETRLRLRLAGAESGAARWTEIPDLAVFVRTAPAAPAGAGRQILLRELCDEVHPDGTRSRTQHEVVRLLDRDSADRWRESRLRHQPEIETVTVLAARLLRADGAVEEAAADGARVSFSAPAPGDAVELAYRIDRFRPDFFGDYFGAVFPFRDEAPVVRARYALVTDPGVPVHLHRTGGAPAPNESVEPSGATLRVWEMRDLPPLGDEPFMPPATELSPTVQVSTFADWNALARWYWHLIRPQYEPTPEIRRLVEQLTRGKTDETEKLRAIYAWVTREVRNVAWSFGVHGYKPFGAGTILARRFGDCKDKALLISVMSREAGLDAWPVLLEATDPTDPVAGRGREDLTLPLLNHFNHCIARVIADGREWWLDGTVAYRDLESLHFTDAGAAAVVVTAEGAQRVDLPAQTAEDNLWSDELRLVLAEDGTGELVQNLAGRGHVAVYLRAYFGNPAIPPGAVFQRVAASIFGPVRQAEAVFRPDPVEVKLEGRARLARATAAENGRVSLALPRAFLRGELARGGALPGALGVFAPCSARENDLVLPLPFAVRRRITLAWPAGWTLVRGVDPVEVEEDFGRFAVKAEQVGTTLTLEVTLELRQTRIPRARYERFRRLAALADRFDAEPLVWEKP